MSKMLGLDDILNANDKAVEYVEVTEWGGRVRVQTCSGEMRDAFESLFVDPANAAKAMHNMRARLVAACVSDDDGKLVFALAHVQALGQKSGIALNKVFEAARRVSGMADDAVEDAEENSPGDRNGSSGSN